jgi:hypothetical protein
MCVFVCSVCVLFVCVCVQVCHCVVVFLCVYCTCVYVHVWSSFTYGSWSRACGASVRSSDSGSEGMGFDPHSDQSKVRLFSLSILTDKIVLVVQSTPPSTGSLVSV